MSAPADAILRGWRVLATDDNARSPLTSPVRRQAALGPQPVAPTISAGEGAAQGGAEFGDLLLGHLRRQDRLRPVEGAGPLVQLD
jgi:hypothetical protein